MARTPPPPTPSLEALLAAATPEAPLSGELLRMLRPPGVVGALAQMPLTEILQNLDFGKRSARVDAWPEGAEGVVVVNDGQIVHAATTTAAGTTVGEAAILELCRRSDGYFRILYQREEVQQTIHRPTTFVLLEALRVLDEASARRGETPAAVELGAGAAPIADTFPPDLFDEGDAGDAFNEPSAEIQIDVGSESDGEPVAVREEHPRHRAMTPISITVAEVGSTALLEDIGLGGAFVRSDVQPAVGTLVQLHLPTSDGAMPVPALVAHLLPAPAAATLARQAGFGVRFDVLPGSAAQRLASFVEVLAASTPTGGAAMAPRDRLLSLVAESEFLVAAGDLESAKRVLSRAQGLAPEDDHVRHKLLAVNESIDAAQANTFLERAMRGGPHAVQLARRATQLRPVRDVLLRSLAVFARGGALDEVVDVAEQLLELDPDDEGALRTLLDASVSMQRWSVAAHAAESLLRLRPRDEQVRTTHQRAVAMARRPL